MSVTAELADGRRLEFPDGTKPEVVQATVKRVLADGADKPAEPPSAKDNWLQGAFDVAATAATAPFKALGFAGGALGGIAASIASGKYGTQEGAQMAAETAGEGANRFSYQPQSEQGKAALEAIAKGVDATKIAGLGPAEAVALGGVVSAARPAVRQVRGAAAKVLAKDVPDEPAAGAPAMSGTSQFASVGSAGVTDEVLRRSRAAALPVPIQLTKGQATRTFEQQQFERETAKNPKVGEPLRQRFAEQNQQILQNFDAWVDQTGAEAGSLRATGEAVSQAVVNKSNRAKTEIRTAYRQADEAGAMAEKVDITPLKQYLAEHQPEAINAPVLTSVETKLTQLAGKEDALSIKGLEEIRKMVGKLSGKDATNATFGGEVKKLIDALTEDKGGEAYKRARKLRFQYGQEFERQGVVNKLLSKKPGTNDRAVAFEDVFEHSIMKGSLDDVRAMRKTLQTAGPEGTQAWRELQGATVKHIRDEISKTATMDVNGSPVVSPARLNALVTALDKDGKLEFIFGKQGAQQIRDVNGIAMDVFTSPPGSVNHPNTASVLLKMLDTVASKTTGVPGLGWATGAAAKEWEAAGLRKRVRDALQEPKP